MADKRITDLTTGTPKSTDVIPFVDVLNGITKKVEFSWLQAKAYYVVGSEWGADYLVSDYASADLAITAAINAAEAEGGGKVKIQPGTFDTPGRIIYKSNVAVEGSGMGITILFGGNDNDYTFFTSSTTEYAAIRDLTIDCNNTNNAAGLRAYFNNHCTFERIEFKNVEAGGWHMKMGVIDGLNPTAR